MSTFNIFSLLTTKIKTGLAGEDEAGANVGYDVQGVLLDVVSRDNVGQQIWTEQQIDAW